MNDVCVNPVGSVDVVAGPVTSFLSEGAVTIVVVMSVMSFHLFVFIGISNKRATIRRVHSALFGVPLSDKIQKITQQR